MTDPLQHYHQQLRCSAAQIDTAFWRNPTGVTIPDDELAFLLVPDAAHAMAVTEVAYDVNRFQQEAGPDNAITAALIATMGGMLPGILLHDHLVHGRPAGSARMAFGTIGVSLYKGPNERYEQPRVQQAASINIPGENVLVIDDLGDRGGTLAFLHDHLVQHHARRVMTLALYMKPQAMAASPVDFHFGEVEQHTWIITPRELVETLAKRVPVWRERGADQAECRRRLVELIGYPAAVADRYLPPVFSAR